MFYRISGMEKTLPVMESANREQRVSRGGKRGSNDVMCANYYVHLKQI